MPISCSRIVSYLYRSLTGDVRVFITNWNLLQYWQSLAVDRSRKCYKWKMDLVLVFLFLSSTVYGETLQCSVTEVKSLLEGCDRLTGLNVTSVGGTIVDDHNCDVLLPKQVFFEEPLFQYALADAVRILSSILTLLMTNCCQRFLLRKIRRMSFAKKYSQINKKPELVRLNRYYRFED